MFALDDHSEARNSNSLCTSILIIDEIKNISGEEMKAQLADTSDILTTLDLAPPTKRY